MPNLNAANAAGGRPKSDNPAPFATWGWKHSDPYAGDQGADPYPPATIRSSYGPPRGPADPETRTQYAGMAHLIKAIQQTREGRYTEFEPAYVGRILTPTSFVYSTGAVPAEPSEWKSGLQIPDWRSE